MKALLALCMITSAAYADTYKLGVGVVGGEHRCAVPAAKARLTNLVDKDPRITVGHGQMTITTDKPRGADRIVDDKQVHTGFWEGKPDANGALTIVEIVIDTYGEATTANGNKHQPEAWIRVALTFDGATCIEEWHGKADLVH